MRQLFQKVRFPVLAAVMVWFLLDSGTVRQSAQQALSLCVRNVIPALFPFLVVASLLVSLGIGDALARPLGRFMEPLFHVSGCGASALLLGLIGGYPVGGRTVAELRSAGSICPAEGRRLLTFTNNANPAFFLSVLGVGVFDSTRIGLALWLIHVLSALLTGILLCRRGAVAPPTSRHTPPPPSFPAAFVTAVGGSAAAILNVCAFVVLFSVLAAPLTRLPGLWDAAAVGTLELFSATALLPLTRPGFILAAGLSGWGGLSVLCQTAAVLEDSALPVSACALGKLVQGLLSAALAAAASVLFF